jgi:ABC-type glycerol-3-phosphate transport system substrate-binding protein
MDRRIYVVITILAVVVLLSACGGGGSTDALTSTGPIKIWYSDNP